MANKWKQTEQRYLVQLVKKLGTDSWMNISQQLNSRFTDLQRSEQQCKDRWLCYLSKNSTKLPWNDQQTTLMFELYSNHGNKWKQISQKFNTRSQNNIKNHFYAQLRKGMRRINKVLGFAYKPEILKRIKPSILASVYQQILHANNQKSIVDQQTKDHQKDEFNHYLTQLSRCEPSQVLLEEILCNQELICLFKGFLSTIVQKNDLYILQKEAQKRQRSLKKIERQPSQEKDDISKYLCLSDQTKQSRLFQTKSFTSSETHNQKQNTKNNKLIKNDE